MSVEGLTITICGMIELFTIVYAVSAFLLALYTSGQAILLFQYWRKRNQSAPLPDIADVPTVTIQLPFYNEQHVATRLINAIAELDYPREKLQIQVLDDSTDSTVQTVARTVFQLQMQGYQIEHIRRTNRTGYKAGALAFGMTRIQSDFVAIFDADFIPPRDFLKQTIPHLVANKNIGVVQTRWGHLNDDENWLTRAQMLSIDAHFVVEQTARNRSGWLIPFNGTGGVWRADCIRSAGGWSADTLTEDLDLSYRAQMLGWQSLFLPDIEVPGEIPPQLTAYKQQQSRWAMGNTQCLLKLSRPILRADLSLSQKIMGIQHLCQYLPHPLMLLLLLLTPPLLLSNALLDLPLAPLGIIGLAPPLMYVLSQMRLHKHWRSRLKAFPALLLIGTGISLSNTLSVMGAIFGAKVEFRRTPKFGQTGNSSPYALHGDVTILLEWVLMGYALWGAWLAWQIQRELTVYLLIYALSFATISLWGLRESWTVRRVATPHQPHATGS